LLYKETRSDSRQEVDVHLELDVGKINCLVSKRTVKIQERSRTVERACNRKKKQLLVGCDGWIRSSCNDHKRYHIDLSVSVQLSGLLTPNQLTGDSTPLPNCL